MKRRISLNLLFCIQVCFFSLLAKLHFYFCNVIIDRDCCNAGSSHSKFQKLFCRWEKIVIRLDSWHFMRRLSKACSNESHPLYASFMTKISSAIFEWDKMDVELLRNAKREELKQAGVQNPSLEAVNKAVTKFELARHCRRKTRGTEATVSFIEELFVSLQEATDSLGVPLLREDSMDIWREEKRHVPCLQDPCGVLLYTKTKELSKGGIWLPVFRCARGTTSLESFHSHLKNFIPGINEN